MKAFFRLCCAGFLGVVGYAYLTFPASVPVHFDVHGEADRFESRAVVTISILGIGVMLMLLFEVLIRTLPAMGAATLNIPHRDHWQRPEHRAELRAKLTSDVSFLGACTMLLLSGGILLTREAVSEPISPGLGGAGLLLLLLFAALTLGQVVFMYTTRYRPPLLRLPFPARDIP